MPTGHDRSTDDEADAPGETEPEIAADGGDEQPRPAPPDEPADQAADEPADEAGPPEEDDASEYRPEDVREGVVDLVAYVVGAAGLILLGYFTQRDVLTWTRGPFVVVCIILAVHWIGRRIQARKTGDAR
ncbi:MAG: hypothetical protein HOU01_10715 [Streptomycetaceae bacterium]|nr:hypothetical protein [Streptomycetaceae bacterium]